jgi:hypothetical protein
LRYVGAQGGSGGVAAEILNLTDGHQRVEAFIRAKAALIDDTAGLSVHIKHTRARGRDVTGYYRFADRRIVLAVKKRLKYPRQAAYGVGSKPVDRKRLGSRPYKLVWYEETFTSAEDLLVFVAGHEFWHFLCHSGQRRGDFEVRANCHGFMWLGEFQRWSGSPNPVEPIPFRPLRPDLPPPAPAAPQPAPLAARPTAVVVRRPVQGELF